MSQNNNNNNNADSCNDNNNNNDRGKASSNFCWGINEWSIEVKVVVLLIIALVMFIPSDFMNKAIECVENCKQMSMHQLSGSSSSQRLLLKDNNNNNNTNNNNNNNTPTISIIEEEEPSPSLSSLS